MDTSTPPTILFADEAAANHLVAGIPAAARAVMNAARELSGEPIIVAAPNGWTPSALCSAEIERLSPNTHWSNADTVDADTSQWLSGADLQSGLTEWQSAIVSQMGMVKPADIPALRDQARFIIASTGKTGDGIISRTINRPISQAMSRILLRWPSVRPWHATLAAALIGIAMFVALLFGGAAGLIAGAALFQFASIVDGVDGEIARATFRTSDRGAMMDSVTDAATNLGFIGSASYNLYVSGAHEAGLAGAFGFAILALGSAVLALQSRRDGGAFTFDALKTRFRERPSQLKQWLTYITMRDFYAFAAFVAIVFGAAVPLLFVFAAVATGWFIVLCWTLVIARQ